MRRNIWDYYPLVNQEPTAHAWLEFQINRGLAPNSVNAYAHALEGYLQFCSTQNMSVLIATREHIALYIRHLRERPLQRGEEVRRIGCSPATVRQRLCAIRLYYAYLVEDGLREINPVGKGRYVEGKPRQGQRGLTPSYETLPWIPSEAEWLVILQEVQQESVRNRLMFALAYDGGLRREELCSLATGDIDPAHRLLHLRAENTKNRRARVVPYSEVTAVLYSAYLQERRLLSRERGRLFLSDSPRNRAQPISIWSWSKIIHNIAVRAGIDRFATHTLRHLCLTDLARAGWDIHEIALFAGHRGVQTTLLYIHLSGRELSAKFQNNGQQLHNWRMRQIGETFSV